MKEIIMQVVGDAWFATLPGDDEMVRLFGTETIPTPFLASVDPETVRSEIAARNPSYTVRVWGQPD